jgi:coenzyme F420-reducing hydrogenase delta subunit
VDRLQQLLEQVGLEGERVRMFNMSSAMANQFVAAAEEMTEQVSNLGASPLRGHKTEDSGDQGRRSTADN